jgi:HEAT repeat protein
MRSLIPGTLAVCVVLIGGLSTADDGAGKTAEPVRSELPPNNLPGLIKELRTSPCLSMPASASELVKIGKPAVPALVELLDSPTWVLRWKAARVLGLIGPDAKEALPALEKALQREKPHFFERRDIPLAIAAIKADTKR